MTAQVDLDDLRGRVQREIGLEIGRQRRVLAELGTDTDRLVDPVETLLSGGKRLRAAFCHVGYVAGHGTHLDESVRLATAMEFFQAAALLHDDVMDDSDTRRGAPTAHVQLSDEHAAAGWSGEPFRFGLAGAILAGDLCLVWSEDVFASCGLPPEELARARPCFAQMRTQLMAGQFLDVLVSVRGWDEVDTAERIAQARRVVQFKSARYSVQQPLLIGADAAGVDARDRELLATYGSAVGEAFQMRDDVLGVFGDPEETGKPAGDDLREGKRTVLLAYVLDGCTPAQREELRRVLGNPEADATDIDRARQIVLETGAVPRLERLIDSDTAAAREALAATTGLAPQGVEALEQLIDLSTVRTT